MSFRVAVVQFKIAHWNREKNFQRIENFIKKAKKQKAQVIVFPEDCVTGSIFGDLKKLDTKKENRQKFCVLAKKYSIDVITGSSMEGTKTGNFNTSYYINAKGRVVGTYQKNHLYPSENSFLQPGTVAPGFKTVYGKAAIVICWDMLFPEIFERLKKQGVQIIYCPSYWYQEIAGSMKNYNKNSEEQLLDALCLTRAVETNAVIVYCNAAGVMKNPDGSCDTLIGHSQVVMPVLGNLKKINSHREDLLITDIDLKLLVKTKEIYKK